MAETTPEQAFRTRATQWSDQLPRYAMLCEAVARDIHLVESMAGAAQSPWALPDLVMAAATRLLRTTASAHPLAEYWPTVGGQRGPDAGMVTAFSELMTRYQPELAAICAERGTTRANDPQAAAMLWPGLAWAAGTKPVALIELGGTAGFCLLPDKYAYQYDGNSPGAAAMELAAESRGTAIPDALAPMDIRMRIGIELDPVRHDDTAAVEWLRDCVRADRPEELARVDASLAEPALADVDWRAGDYFDELPAALASVPDGVMPIVYGAHTLCCATEPERLPRMLAESGRDLVWLAKEVPDDALGLVSDAAVRFNRGDDHPPILITGAVYRRGRLVDLAVLAEVDVWGRWVGWNPRDITV